MGRCAIAALGITVITAVLVVLPVVAQQPLRSDPAPVRFVKKQLDDHFRSEGVAVGDFNRDGRMDIAAGVVWYEAPAWRIHPLVLDPPAYDPKRYSNSFCNFVLDVNQDDWPDLIVVDFPGTPTWWLENPGRAGIPWRRHVVVPVTNNESPQLVDIDGDGKKDLLAAFSPDPDQPDGPHRRMGYAVAQKDPTAPWQWHVVSEPAAPGTQKYSHGLGAGDLNGDGRVDILVPQGWWECPADRSHSPWTFHPASFGENGERAAHLMVTDVDGDGDADVIASSPHSYGIWWHEQLPNAKWKTHLIDRSYSQTHALCLADLDGDGLPDLVTGKRWWAHGGRDPGGNEPAVLYWYRLQRTPDGVHWEGYQIDNDSGIGTQFEVADVDGDGRLDIVTSNKKGVFFFRQVPR